MYPGYWRNMLMFVRLSPLSFLNTCSSTKQLKWCLSLSWNSDIRIDVCVCMHTRGTAGVYGGIVCNETALMDESWAPSELSGNLIFSGYKSKISLPLNIHLVLVKVFALGYLPLPPSSDLSCVNKNSTANKGKHAHFTPFKSEMKYEWLFISPVCGVPGCSCISVRPCPVWPRVKGHVVT